MAFRPVLVYDTNGAFLGFTIKNDDALKLHTENLWSDTPEDQADLREQLARLSDNVDVRQFWPDVRDPDVVALIDDPEFLPLKLSPVEVIDEDASVYVWITEPSDDDPFGQMDRDKSVIVHKTEMAPSPVEVQARVKKACEIVARRRAQEAQGVTPS